MRTRLLLLALVAGVGLTGGSAVGLPPPPPPPPSPPQPLPPPPQTRRCVVPNVKRMTVRQARSLLVVGGCQLGRVSRAYSRGVRRGRIIAQSRRFGARLPRGTKVNVVVSRGPRPSP